MVYGLPCHYHFFECLIAHSMHKQLSTIGVARNIKGWHETLQKPSKEPRIFPSFVLWLKSDNYEKKNTVGKNYESCNTITVRTTLTDQN